MHIYDYAIIGCGISGATAARLLSLRGLNNYIVLEANNEPGGLCRSKNINNHTLDIGGGHFLCSKYDRVYDFIFSHIDKSAFNQYNRVSKIKLGNHIIDYPIEYNIWQLPTDMQVQYLLSMLDNRSKNTSSNYYEWIINNLGTEIATNFMVPYNNKLWGVHPETMDIDWLYKIPSLDKHAILKSIIEHTNDKSKFPSHTYFLYPKSGGFQSIFDAIYNKIENVKLNEPVHTISRTDTWLINNKYGARIIINTAPWPTLKEGLCPPSSIKWAFDELAHNSIYVDLYEEPYNHDWHWCYIPDHMTRHHREFYINNYTVGDAPNGLYTETNKNRHLNNDAIASYYNEYAYPIPVIGHTNAKNTILNYYKRLGLYGLGRWGQWEYFNSDVCILEAMKLIDIIAS